MPLFLHVTTQSVCSVSQDVFGATGLDKYFCCCTLFVSSRVSLRVVCSFALASCPVMFCLFGYDLVVHALEVSALQREHLHDAATQHLGQDKCSRKNGPHLVTWCTQALQSSPSVASACPSKRPPCTPRGSVAQTRAFRELISCHAEEAYLVNSKQLG